MTDRIVSQDDIDEAAGEIESLTKRVAYLQSVIRKAAARCYECEGKGENYDGLREGNPRRDCEVCRDLRVALGPPCTEPPPHEPSCHLEWLERGQNVRPGWCGNCGHIAHDHDAPGRECIVEGCPCSMFVDSRGTRP